MKTLKYIFTFFFCFLLTLYAQVSYNVSFNKSELEYGVELAKDGENYQILTIENLGYTQQVGAPKLPVMYVKLIIPAQQDVDEVEYTFSVSNKTNLTNKIYPTQHDIPTAINIEEPDFVKPDPIIYNSEKPWPEEVVEFIHSGYLDENNHIITLKVVPFQYYPKLDEIEELNDFQINLSLKPNNKEIILPKFRSIKTQEIWDNVLNQIVDNKADISQYQYKPKLSNEFEPNVNQLKKPTPCQFYEYTIITSNSLRNYFNDFVNYKKSKGINTGVVKTSSIYFEYQGDYISNLFDNAGKIRQYLRDLYEVGGTWVLLAGDFSVVPIRYGCGYIIIYD